MKYYIIAGEASGDLHGANLIRELKNLDGSSQFRCWGGDRMKSQGADVAMHYSKLAFMGFWEVIVNFQRIWKNFRFCMKDIEKFAPDAIILIDYPGFNLRIARLAKRKGYKVFYYISPQVWAWKASRIKGIKKYVDRMFVILPFEKKFYASFGYDVDFVGHPLLDALDSFQFNEAQRLAFFTKHELDKKNIIALLPGSREQEIVRVLPFMIKTALCCKDYHFIVAGSSTVPESVYKKCMTGIANHRKNVSIVFDETYSLLKCAVAALVTSGTATLEAALHEVPEIVCYKGNHLSYLIAKRLIKTKWISLVNIIMDKEVVKEFIQNDLTPGNLSFELNTILLDKTYRNNMKENMKNIRTMLGGKGASRRAAELVMKYIVK